MKDQTMTTPLSDGFIRDNCTLAPIPMAPEIKLWLATEITPLWQATEDVLGEIPPPFWAFIWAGGQALTRYVLDHPALVAGKRVLDFAAGSGASGIASAMCGADQVDMADIDPLARIACSLNASANGVQVSILEGDVVGADNRWDVILAGDVCYEKPMTSHIFPWLQKMAAQGAIVLMADPGRAYLPQGLKELAHYVVPTTLELEDRTSREVRVYQIGH